MVTHTVAAALEWLLADVKISRPRKMLICLGIKRVPLRVTKVSKRLNKCVFKRLKVSRHSLALYDALLRLVDCRAPFLHRTKLIMVLALYMPRGTRLCTCSLERKGPPHQS